MHKWATWFKYVYGYTPSLNVLWNPTLIIILNQSSIIIWVTWNTGFPGGTSSKESSCLCRGRGSIPGSQRSPGVGNGNPHQYSCPENSTDRGAWQATVHQLWRVRHDWAHKHASEIQEVLARVSYKENLCLREIPSQEDTTADTHP